MDLNILQKGSFYISKNPCLRGQIFEVTDIGPIQTRFGKDNRIITYNRHYIDENNLVQVVKNNRIWLYYRYIIRETDFGDEINLSDNEITKYLNFK